MKNRIVTLHLNLLICFMLFSLYTNAQEEYLSPVYSNQVIKSYRMLHPDLSVASKKGNLAGDTLILPVFDDFSAPGIYPDPEIWNGKNVFINSGYSSNPPTLGMATFDGLNEYGDPYDKTFTTQYGSTDTLESKPINLFDDGNGNQYTSSDSISLSFYYQRRGLGDSPEFGDSLTLDFYNPSDSLWYWQWSLGDGGFDIDFIRVFIPVTDTLFFKKGFKFRFRTYGSQTGSLDNWNLDFVILRKPFFANDYLINDIGYQLPAHSLVRNYTSIPYSHYKSLDSVARNNVMVNSDSLTVFNLFKDPSAPSQANLRIYDQFGNQLFQYAGPGAANIVIPANATFNYDPVTPSLGYSYDSVQGNYREFEVVHNLATPNQDFNKNNDTLHYRQVFDNYYAYDDGSAEASYSLNTAPGGKLACSFDLMKGDTLRGVFIHWCQKSNDVSLKLFKLVIYYSLKGVPSASVKDSIIYQEFNQKPAYIDSINGFRYYRFSDFIVLPAGQFYVAIVQTAVDELYLGFDRNNDSHSRRFFNTTGTWNQSQLEGSFMIRPVFGDSVITTGITPEVVITSSILVFPNPANDRLFVKTDMKSLNNLNYEIVDITGRIIKPAVVFQNQVDISMFSEGLYFIRFYDPSNNYFSVQKFIISRH